MIPGGKTHAQPANEPDCQAGTAIGLAVVQTALNELTHATFSESQGMSVDPLTSPKV